MYGWLEAGTIPEGSIITFELSPITNPNMPLCIAGFVLTSYTDKNKLYFIDRVGSNLAP